MFDLDKYIEYLYVMGELDKEEDYDNDLDEEEEEDKDFPLDTKNFPRLRNR